MGIDIDMARQAARCGAATLFVLGLSGGTAYAAFEDPASASWGGWTRGDTGTIWQYWAAIEDEDGAAPFVYDDSPDAGSFGPGGVTRLEELTGAGFVTGSGAGGNVYSFSGATEWLATVAGFGPTGDPTRVAVQIKTQGTEVAYDTVTLGGAAFDARTELSRVAAGGFGGDIVETLFLWTLPDGLSSYDVAFEAAGSSMSLDEFAIDVAPVPLPLPAALLGSAVVGLAGVGRRRSV